MRGRSTSFIAVFGALLLVAFVGPRPAAAGEYTIHICEADEARYTSSAFEEFAERGMKWRRACDPLGPKPRGIVSANVPRPGRVARGAESGFILSAPPGTSFSRLRWSGHTLRRDCRYALQVYADGGPAPVSIKNVRANRGCPRPGLAQASSYPQMRAFDLVGATRIIQRVVCVGTPSHEYCSSRGKNYVATLAAEATVVDGTAPSVSIAQDSAFARGEWVRGKQSFTYQASDNVGIKSASAFVAGAVRGTHSWGCNYTHSGGSYRASASISSSPRPSRSRPSLSAPSLSPPRWLHIASSQPAARFDRAGPSRSCPRTSSTPSPMRCSASPLSSRPPSAGSRAG